MPTETLEAIDSDEMTAEWYAIRDRMSEREVEVIVQHRMVPGSHDVRHFYF